MVLLKKLGKAQLLGHFAGLAPASAVYCRQRSHGYHRYRLSELGLELYAQLRSEMVCVMPTNWWNEVVALGSTSHADDELAGRTVCWVKTFRALSHATPELVVQMVCLHRSVGRDACEELKTPEESYFADW